MPPDTIHRIIINRPAKAIATSAKANFTEAMERTAKVRKALTKAIRLSVRDLVGVISCLFGIIYVRFSHSLTRFCAPVK